MSSETEQLILAELKMLRREVADLKVEGAPPMTQSAFARKLGVNRRTVHRMIQDRRIRTDSDGKVPAKFLKDRLT